MENNRFILEDNGKTIGYLLYEIKGDTLDIISIYVDSSYRGQNKGQVLFDMALSFSKENNLKLTSSCSYGAKLLEKLS